LLDGWCGIDHEHFYVELNDMQIKSISFYLLLCMGVKLGVSL